MNSRFIIIAILIFIKVIGIASRVRADNFVQTWEMYCNSQQIGFYSFSFEGCDEDRETKSIEEIAFDHKKNKRINDFLKSKGIY